MKLNKLTKEELETMSYNDIAYEIIKKEKPKTTAELLKKIIELLNLPSKTYENKIGNFYTSLTNDKRFILTEDSSWDLRENHKLKKHVEEDEDCDDLEEMDEEIDEDFEDEDEDELTNSIKEEYKDLVIIDEEDLD